MIDKVVFIVEDSAIFETTIRNFDGHYIEETTTPHGVAPKYHVRGNELWTWGHQGNSPRMIRALDTEADAVEALEDSFAHDFWNASEILAFKDRASAEACLREMNDEVQP